MTTMTSHTRLHPSPQSPAALTAQFRKLYRHDDRVEAAKRILTRVMILAVSPSVGVALITLITRR
jgi:hypothetical protein